MPAEIVPTALGHLIDFAERPRAQDWSLRAALVRYAQSQPQRASDILDLVRRVESALGKGAAVIEREGQDLWDALDGAAHAEPDAHVVGVLRAAKELDRLGDILASWAVDGTGTRPDAEVDSIVEEVAPQLDALGVPHEERPPGPRDRG